MKDFDDFLGRDLRLFGVDEDFINKLRWMDDFVSNEVEPLDTLGFSPYDTTHPVRKALFPPLQRVSAALACPTHSSTPLTRSAPHSTDPLARSPAHTRLCGKRAYGLATWDRSSEDPVTANLSWR